jgi:hypothetical protein
VRRLVVKLELRDYAVTLADVFSGGGGATAIGCGEEGAKLHSFERFILEVS